jgi:hypothetical protein
MSPIPPIPPNPPILRIRAAAVAAIVVTAIVAGCGGVPPSIDGLLVASGGPLQVTDGAGDLVAFDGPPDPVVAVTASDGRVVAATADGSLVTSSGSGGTRTWTSVAVPGGVGAGVPLMAASPFGRKLALAVGEPQGSTFELVLADVGLGTSHSISVQRGLNGPPAWIGPGIVAVDVINAAGESALATIDIATGAVTDDALAGQVVSATLDGERLAFDDPATGEVLVGDARTAGQGPQDHVVRLAGPAGAGVESLAISPSGDRLAVVRRTDAGTASIELYRAVEQGWKSARTIGLAGDEAVTVAWLR